MDSPVPSSLLPFHVRSWSEPHVHVWGGGGCCTPVFTGAGDELGDLPSLTEAAGAVGCSVLGCSQGLGRAARAAASVREEVQTLDGAPE